MEDLTNAEKVELRAKLKQLAERKLTLLQTKRATYVSELAADKAAYERYQRGNFTGLDKYIQIAKDSVQSRKQKLKRDIYNKAARSVRVGDTDITSYPFNDEFRTYWANNIIDLMSSNKNTQKINNVLGRKKIISSKLSDARVIEIAHKLLPDIDVEIIREALSTYSEDLIVPTYSSSTYPNKYLFFINEIIDETKNYADATSLYSKGDPTRIYSTIDAIRELHYENYNLIVTYGSAGRGNNILPAGPEFQQKFIDRDIVVFVFERVAAAWGDKGYFSSNRESELYRYLVNEIEVLETDIEFINVNSYVNILRCKIAGHNADFIIVNSYYISLYKPILKPLVRNSHKSIFFDSIHAHSVILNNDAFLQSEFTHYLFAPGVEFNEPKIRLNRAAVGNEQMKNVKYLLDLSRARRDPQIIKDIALRTAYYPLGPSPDESRVAILEEINEKLKRPEYAEIIKFIPQEGLYNLLGGRRKTRRVVRNIRYTRRR